MITPFMWALSVFILLPCRSMPGIDDGPPRVHMVVCGKRVEGEPGSSEWRGIAVDRQIFVPRSTGEVAPGEEIGFAQAGEEPENAYLSVYRADDVGRPDIAPVSEGPIDPRHLRSTVTVEPGAYVLEVSLTWEGEGDTTTFFGLHVQESTRK